MSNDYLLGMDMGTTNMKAIIMDAEGRMIADASRKQQMVRPAPLYAEQDAHAWWDSAVCIFRELKQKAGIQVMENIRGICVSSHSVTLLPLDAAGNVLRNAIIWMDNRADLEVEELTAAIGRTRYRNIIGTEPSGTFLAGKLLWLKKNQPDILEKTGKILQASSYINYRLTGEMTMDISQAVMTQCLERDSGRWSKVVGDAIGVDLDALLPQPKPCGEIIGCVSKKAAQETGLAAGIPVLAGASDCMTSMYATGMTALGDAGESSGTTSMIFAGSRMQSRPESAVSTKPCEIEGMPYIFDAPLSATGASLAWFLDTVGSGYETAAAKYGMNRFEYMNRAADSVRAGSNGVFYYPYLQGERAPLWNSHARGMFIGMTTNTTTADLARAVLEGTAFAIRHVTEVIRAEGGRIDTLRITGGGAKSRTWSKIKASMLKLPVCLLDEKSGEVPFGDVLIAGTAVGLFPDLKTSLKKLVTVKEVIEPDPKEAAYYAEVYPYFIEMYRQLDDSLARLQKTLQAIDR